MGLFNFKKKEQEEVAEETPRQPGNPGAMVTVRVLAAGYLLWMLKDLIKMYIEGGPEAPSLMLIIIAGVLFVGGAVLILWMSYKQYKRMKAEQYAYNEAMAEQVRLEEEAAAAAKAAEEAEEEYEEAEDEETEDEETEE